MTLRISLKAGTAVKLSALFDDYAALTTRAQAKSDEINAVVRRVVHENGHELGTKPWRLEMSEDDEVHLVEHEGGPDGDEAAPDRT